MKRLWMLIVLLRCVIPEGSTPREIRGGGGGPFPRTLTIFMTKVFDFPYPVCDLT